MIVLDGPVGTELALRGVPTPAPGWSAAGLDHPEELAAIHADYAAAGATVHTACTFRTQPRVFADWQERLRRAVAIARSSVPAAHWVAGSLAPIEDCYRPDLAPPLGEARALHRAVAVALAEAGVDLVLCEAFPRGDELAVAVEEAARLGVPAWASLTAGPDGALLSPAELAAGARAARAAGAEVVLVNCVDVARIEPYVVALAALGVPFGVYANAGLVGEAEAEASDEAREAVARAFVAVAARAAGLGASVVGACCGARPSHVRAIAEILARSPETSAIIDRGA